MWTGLTVGGTGRKRKERSLGIIFFFFGVGVPPEITQKIITFKIETKFRGNIFFCHGDTIFGEDLAERPGTMAVVNRRVAV
jgi:hypothetical protein